MEVKAKFRCELNTKQDFGNGETVHNIRLSPVVDGSEENKKFYAATPGGNIQLNTVNAAAAEQFEEGKEYYVTFEKAE